MELRPAGILLAFLGAAAAAVWAEGRLPGEFGRAAFVTRGELPPYRPLTPAEQGPFDVGLQVFNTQFVAAGTPGAGRRSGLGPLFNLPACDACHNDGARGAGPAGDGEIPSSMVLQLSRSPKPGAPLEGDPAYGRTLNTSAVDGYVREGRVFVQYEIRRGAYSDGAPWELRLPRYEVRELGYGPLDPDTVLMPRIPPAIFGVGLLEAASVEPGIGRFGWQGAATSVRDQTTKAAAREMGLTSVDVPRDDCTERELDCRKSSAGIAELDGQLLAALVAFEKRLAVPVVARDSALERRGAELFERIGCSQCHSSTIPVDGRVVGDPSVHVISPYSDLRLHDLGAELADRTVSGRVVESHWRTAPLWGIGYHARATTTLTFLHDGRARSIDEAVLWHGGEADAARSHYTKLSAEERKLLESWVLGR